MIAVGERYAGTGTGAQGSGNSGHHFCSNACIRDRRQLFAAAADETSQRVLLQIGVAARNDEALRTQVQELLG